MSLPRIALVQMDVRAGRPDRNVARMLEFIRRAREAQAEVAGVSYRLRPGQALVVPGGAAHALGNPGDEELEMLVVRLGRGRSDDAVWAAQGT